MIKYSLISFLLWLDFFLFSTGNPSAILYLFGGMYFLHPFIAPYTSIMGFISAKEKSNRFAFVYLIVTLLILFIFILSAESMKEVSKERIRNIVTEFIDGKQNDLVFTENSDDIDWLSIKKDSIYLESYIPIARRGDFVLKDDKNNTYLLIVIEEREGISAYVKLKKSH